MKRFFLLIAVLLFWPGVTAYNLVRDYSGQNFFQGWDFYGSWDNLTLGMCPRPVVCHPNGLIGDVWWLDEADAMSQHLAYINNANNAIIKVDNTSNVALNEKRNTVRSFGIHDIRVF
jgi:hypothetical protein